MRPTSSHAEYSHCIAALDITSLITPPITFRHAIEISSLLDSYSFAIIDYTALHHFAILASTPKEERLFHTLSPSFRLDNNCIVPPDWYCFPPAGALPLRRIY
jgi:hypothetical protein